MKPPPGPDLRNMILTLDPGKVRLTPSDALPHVWGSVMDIGADRGWASLVTLADGTTSLYTSGGGGVIGGGSHEPVLEASGNLLRLIEANLELFEATKDLEPPESGHTRFLILTYEGIKGRSGATEQLSSGRDALSVIFNAGNDLLTQLRLATERRA